MDLLQLHACVRACVRMRAHKQQSPAQRSNSSHSVIICPHTSTMCSHICLHICWSTQMPTHMPTHVYTGHCTRLHVFTYMSAHMSTNMPGHVSSVHLLGTCLNTCPRKHARLVSPTLPDSTRLDGGTRPTLLRSNSFRGCVMSRCGPLLDPSVLDQKALRASNDELPLVRTCSDRRQSSEGSRHTTLQSPHSSNRGGSVGSSCSYSSGERPVLTARVCRPQLTRFCCCWGV